MCIQKSVSFYSRIILISLLLANPMYSFSQYEASNWLLGSIAGITFQSGNPEKMVLPDVSATRIASIISDENGNLLFYTDGTNVWDKTHNLMPNGTGLVGSANSSRVQICPKPGDPSTYYILTTASSFNWGAPNDVARFTEVNMCLNNGLGDIVEWTKNTPLTSTIATRGAVVKHANGIDYWIAFHEWQSRAFYCFLVTKDGINPTPVISNVGSTLMLSGNSTGDGGDMKFSANGKRLGIVISQYATVEVFDFDAATGILSNAVTIPPIFRQNFQTPDYTSGLEFSPDSDKLYVTRTNATLLTQYDLSAGNESAIVKSRVILAGDTLQHYNYDYYIISSLQLGPDGKIYALWIDEFNSAMSVISSPNEPGLNAQYQHGVFGWSHVSLSPNFLYIFPTFAASYFYRTPVIKNDFTYTSSRINFWINTFSTDQPKSIDHVQWDFDDPLSGTFNASNELRPVHEFVSAGIHTVKCIVTWDDNTTSTLIQYINLPDELLQVEYDILPDSVVLCKGNSVTFDTGTLGNVRWQDGTIASQFTASAGGKYWFTTCRSGFIMSETVIVIEETNDPLGMDIIVCPDQKEVELTAAPYHIVEWQDKSTDQTLTVTETGVYWATIETTNCIVRDTISVKFLDADIFPSHDILCRGTSMTLDASVLGYVRWQDGSVSKKYPVNSPGKYWFEVSVDNCVLSDTVQVSLEDIKDPLGSDTTLCQPQAFLQLSSPSYPVLKWQDKSSKPVFTVTKPGLYWAILQTQNCEIKDSIQVDFCEFEVLIPNVITPNGDLMNDTFIVNGLDNENCSFKVFGRDGILRYESSSYKNDWDGGDLPSGTYYYFIENLRVNESFKGWVQIIR